MKELTLLTCNYNTPDLILNLLRSLKIVTKDIPNVLVMNTGAESSFLSLKEYEIPYYNLPNTTHGQAVNNAFDLIETDYVLLVDSDVIFLKDFQKPFEVFKDNNLSIMGNVSGNRGGKQLYPRVDPWFCFINLKQIRSHNIYFYDEVRSSNSKIKGNIVYDIGSTMFEDILKYPNMKIGNVQMEGKYFKHYEGMSWRIQKYNPNDKDTDIDFGGTHPNKQLYDIGLAVREEYLKETSHLKEINIKGAFSDEKLLC